MITLYVTRSTPQYLTFTFEGSLAFESTLEGRMPPSLTVTGVCWIEVNCVDTGGFTEGELLTSGVDETGFEPGEDKFGSVGLAKAGLMEGCAADTIGDTSDLGTVESWRVYIKKFLHWV